jgi:hypothetical protein
LAKSGTGDDEGAGWRVQAVRTTTPRRNARKGEVAGMDVAVGDGNGTGSGRRGRIR